MWPRVQRAKLAVGSLVLAGLLLLAVSLVASPSVAGPAARVLSTLASGLDAERAGDLVMAVPDARGIHPGLPVFRLDAPGALRPLAHVLRVEAGDGQGRVVLRFAPGEDEEGPWRLHAFPPSRKLRAAFEMAVTREAALRFGGAVAERLDRLWVEALLPEAEQRFPAFLARIDPTKDTDARPLVDGLSTSIMQRMAPLLDDLSNTVTAAVKQRFDLLDRLGLLFKILRGDAKGLKKQIMPVAVAAAQHWWVLRKEAVLQAIGAAIGEHAEELRAWAGGELFDAARAELVEPILLAQRERLEQEGETLLRLAAREFVEAPGGGLRVRFAALLRTQLLDKRNALLLLERLERGP